MTKKFKLIIDKDNKPHIVILAPTEFIAQYNEDSSSAEMVNSIIEQAEAILDERSTGIVIPECWEVIIK